LLPPASGTEWNYCTWIFKAMRTPCGKTREPPAKLWDSRLPMGATWRSTVGLRMETCGCWKTIESRGQLLKQKRCRLLSKRNMYKLRPRIFPDADMIAATEIAMRNACWHHDDFLFETQFPTIEEPKESPITAGDELLKRCLRRLRRMQTTREPQPQPQPLGIVKSYYPEIGRTFHPNPRHYQAKL
jgi:hypothetical protein